MNSKLFCKRFLLILPSLLLLVLVASVLLIKYDDPGVSDIRHHDLGYNTVAYHGFSQQNRDNDVVMVGDSTLLMGIMPEVLEKGTGKKVATLGLYATSGLSSFTTLLDHYLAHNRKPECVIFYLSASTPYYFDQHSYEKSYTLVKYGARSPLSLLAEVDPIDVIHTAGTVAQGMLKNLPHLAKSRAQFQADLERMDRSKGFVSNSAEAMGAGARLDSRQQKALSLDFIDKLRERYGKQGIRVLFCLSPLPESDGALKFYQEKYREADNGVCTLPSSYFSDSRHLVPAGAACNSEQFARVLKGILSAPEARLARHLERPTAAGATAGHEGPRSRF